MMDTFKVMKVFVENTVKEMKLTEYCMGEVIAINPIQIDFGENKKITDVGTNIVYTESVIEKKIALRHKHEIRDQSDYRESSEELATYTITEGVNLGDKLLMMRVANGQKFIVLSKVRDTNSITISQELIEC